MKKQLLFCTIALIAFYSISAKAQQADTTKYDLGRITLAKKFTQAVTVKGYDLEKIPFTTLSDAVNTWFYGVYGSAANYVTVIDGSLINDINAYSVYDIEEVTLVQNSLVHLNGISPQQVLLLVKTKRKSRVGSSGVDVIGQANVINSRNTLGSGKSTNNFYHQYYVSPYTNTENVQAGLSATFQQSANPVVEANGLTGNKPYTYSRIKLNGYFDAQLDKNNLFSLNAGYVPQTDTLQLSSVYSAGVQNSSYHVSQNLWYANLKLHSNITGHLTNSFSAGLQQYQLNGNSNANLSSISSTAITNSTSVADTGSSIKTYLIKDDLSYKISSGQWLIEPNVNFTFRQLKSNFSQNSRYTSITYFSGTPFVSGASYGSFIENEQKSATLTPSLSLSYADAVSVQGGFEYFLRFSNANSFLSNNSQYTRPKLLPFVSVTANMLQSSAGSNPDTKLLVFASFAKSMTNMSDISGRLRDGSSLATNNPTLYGYSTGGYFFYSGTYNPYQTFDELQGGAILSLLKSRLSISYNYNVQKHNAPIGTVILVPGTGATTIASNYTIYPDQRLDMHRLGVDFKAYHTEKFSWTTAANFSVVKSNTNLSGFAASPGAFYYYALNGNVTSGGFINRFTYKSFNAGVDMLYRINEDTYAVGTGAKGNINSFDLKNIYVGYQLTPKNTKGLEVFINARNIVQNKLSDITDNRRFYGLGFKLGL